MRLKSWHSLALLFISIFAVYFFSVTAGFNSVDDVKRMNWLLNVGELDVVRLFFPKGNSYYYRPLVTLTYFFDRDLWGFAPSFIHLENIFIHYGSATMVFLLTRHLISGNSTSSNNLALFASLLFAWHPLATEAVCWTSGRYDLLACFFLLVTVWLFIVGLESEKMSIAILGAVSLLLACLAKEVAVFALPGLLWLIIFYDGKGHVINLLKTRFVILLLPVLATVGYFIMRHAATARDTGIKTALKGVVANGDFDLIDKIRIALKVYGFYFKKLFIPWPLNFGIVEVSNTYVIVGLFFVVVFALLIWQRDPLSALVLTGFCVLLPALLVVFGKMAWTPIAERYAYITTAFCAAPVAIWISIFFQRFKKINLLKLWVSPVAVLTLFYGTTVHRAWIWQDNERLFRDTLMKSPGFPPAKAELATALTLKGKTAEAELLLQEMHKTDDASSYIVDDINLAMLMAQQGDCDRAHEVLLSQLSHINASKKRYTLFQKLLKVNDCRLAAANEIDKKIEIRKESLSWLNKQLQMRPGSFTQYRIGKVQLALGNKKEAYLAFKQAYEESSTEAHYHAAAGKLATKLEKELK